MDPVMLLLLFSFLKGWNACKVIWVQIYLKSIKLRLFYIGVSPGGESAGGNFC